MFRHRYSTRKIIDVLKNPLYDRVDRAIKIKLENFDESCFSKRHGNVVTHIIFFAIITDLLSLLRNALITVKQYLYQNVHIFNSLDILVLNQEIFLGITD